MRETHFSQTEEYQANWNAVHQRARRDFRTRLGILAGGAALVLAALCLGGWWLLSRGSGLQTPAVAQGNPPVEGQTELTGAAPAAIVADTPSPTPTSSPTPIPSQTPAPSATLTPLPSQTPVPTASFTPELTATPACVFTMDVSKTFYSPPPVGVVYPASSSDKLNASWVVTNTGNCAWNVVAVIDSKSGDLVKNFLVRRNGKPIYAPEQGQPIYLDDPLQVGDQIEIVLFFFPIQAAELNFRSRSWNLQLNGQTVLPALEVNLSSSVWVSLSQPGSQGGKSSKTNQPGGQPNTPNPRSTEPAPTPPR